MLFFIGVLNFKTPPNQYYINNKNQKINVVHFYFLLYIPFDFDILYKTHKYTFDSINVHLDLYILKQHHFLLGH